MDLDIYTAQLRENLSTAASLGDEKTQSTAKALGIAAESANRLVLLNALSELAATVNAVQDTHTVQVSLAGSTLKVEVRDTAAAAPPTNEHPSFEDVTGDISRVTLRLVEQIKSKAEEAASQSGVSLNSWVSQAVQGALKDQMRWGDYAHREANRWSGRPRRDERPSPTASDETSADGAQADPLRKEHPTE